MSIGPRSDDGARACDAEIMRLRAERERASSLREQAELSVAIEEAMGGRPPTRTMGLCDDYACAWVGTIGDCPSTESSAIWEGAAEPDVTWGENGIDSLMWADVECDFGQKDDLREVEIEEAATPR